MKRIHPEQPAEIEQIAAKEKEKKFVEAVENLPASVSAFDKVNILLMYKGYKVGTVLSFGPYSDSPEGHEDKMHALADCDEAQSVLERFGLCPMGAAEHSYEEEGELLHIQNLSVARNKENAAQFETQWGPYARGLVEGKLDPENERMFGYLLGFPATAVNAFADFKKSKGEQAPFLLDRESLPIEIVKQDFLAFSAMRFSRDNWQEEMNLTKKWAEEIKQMSPKIYDQRVEKYHQEMHFEEIEDAA